MRWRKIDSRKAGNIRYINKFLLFPKTLSGETRWLENVTIKQVLEYWQDITCGASGLRWTSVEWEDRN